MGEGEGFPNSLQVVQCAALLVGCYQCQKTKSKPIKAVWILRRAGGWPGGRVAGRQSGTVILMLTQPSWSWSLG